MFLVLLWFNPYRSSPSLLLLMCLFLFLFLRQSWSLWLCDQCKAHWNRRNVCMKDVILSCECSDWILAPSPPKVCGQEGECIDFLFEQMCTTNSVYVHAHRSPTSFPKRSSPSDVFARSSSFTISGDTRT